MPLIVTVAVSNRLNPSIGIIRCFYSAMILLHDIVQIFTGTDPHATRHATLGFQFPDGPMRSGIGIQSDHAWRSVVSDCVGEETFGRGHIPAFAQQKVHRPPAFVDCSIKIGPVSSHLYVGLVTSSGTIHISSVAAPALFEFRNVALHPSQNRCMSQDHAAFGHHPDQVSGTQLETQIPPDTKHNNFLIEMSSFEENEAWRRGHLTIIPSSPICFHRLHQNQKISTSDAVAVMMGATAPENIPSEWQA